MFSIGEFSKLAKTTVKTLRFYDEVGLFKPSHTELNGYRYYSIDDLNRLTLILQLREIGLSVSKIKAVMSGDDLKTALVERKASLEKEIEDIHNNQSLINTMISQIDKGEFIMEKYHAKEIIVPEFKAYYRHGKIDTMADLFDFVLGAGAECSEHNPELECEDYCYITYEAEQYQETDVELEYTEAVKEFGNESKNIKFRTVPEIRAISVTHKGTYAKLGEAYAYAVNYAKEKGYTIAGKIREIYIHGCWDCENEDDYETAIQVPIK